MKIRGIEIRRSDAPPLVKRAQAEMLRCLSQARTLVELRERIPQALETIRAYRRYLQDGLATVEELAIAKSLTKNPQTYRHQTLSMIAAQELLARGIPRTRRRLILRTVCGRWPDSMGPGAATSRSTTTCF